MQQIEYTAFGESFADWRTEDWNAPYRFTGKEQDAETGLYYYGARYYDPRLGRFLSVDPLAEKYAGWSPYAYVFDNPLKFTDPTGMEADWYPEYDENNRTIYLVAEKGDNKKTFKEWANSLFSDKEIDNLLSSMEGGKIDLGDTEVGRFAEGFINDQADNCDFNCFSSTQSGEQDFNEKIGETDFRSFMASEGLTEQPLNSETLKDAKPFNSYFGYTNEKSGKLDHVSTNAGKDRSGTTWVLTKNGFRPKNSDGSLGGGARFEFQKGIKYSYTKKSPDKIFK